MSKFSREGPSSQISSQYPIETWQNTASTEVEKQPQGVVARIFENCQESLRCLVQNLDSSSVPKRDRNILRRCHAVLLLWGEGHGVSTGALDAILSRSKSLRQMTLSILNPICKTLSRGLRHHITLDKRDDAIEGLISAATKLDDQTRLLLIDATDGTSDSESDSESSCDEGVVDNLQELAQSIKVYTDCLTDLSSALTCPALEPEYDNEPSAVALETHSANDYHTELIRAKFPRAEMILLQCLGRTSWDRYLRMQRERDSNAHIVAVQDGRSCFSKSEFQDSGIGTSLPQGASTYAETIISFATSISGGKRVDIPPLPPGAKKGMLFECNACGNSIKATNNRDWRKHLFMDLRPYTCFFANCAFVDNPFSNRQLWIGHLEIEHGFGPNWEDIQCPLCLEHTGSGKGVVLTHFARHMEDIALVALPRGVDSDVESDSETSSCSDSVRRPESTVDESIRGIGGWLESTAAPDHAPQLEALFNKDEGAANTNPGSGIRREDQEEKSTDGSAYYDPIRGYYRDTDKPDVDLNSSNQRRVIESTDVELQRVAESHSPPPAPRMRNDEGTEGFDQPSMSRRDIEPRRKVINRRSQILVEWRKERKTRRQRQKEAQNTFKKAVDPDEREDEASHEPQRPMSKCNSCREDNERCLPYDRKWPAECDRCNEYGFTCSAGKMNAPSRADRTDKLPGISTLDLDLPFDTPPARGQSREDIDTADSTSDFYKDLDPWPEPALPSPLNFATWDSFSERHNVSSPSGGEQPEQSNASALRALGESPEYSSDSSYRSLANSDPAMEAAFVERVNRPNSPRKAFAMKALESEPLETGSYDTTRSTYFYSDTSQLDARRHDQSPTTQRPEAPLSPTTMSAEPRQRGTSASKDAQKPATGPAQTPHEAQVNHHNKKPLNNVLALARFRAKAREQKETDARERAELDMNDNLPAPWAPQSQDTTPHADTPPLPSAAHPASWPSEDDLSLDLSPQPPFSALRNNQKQTEHSKQRPPVPLLSSQPRKRNPYLNHYALSPSPANGSKTQ